MPVKKETLGAQLASVMTRLNDNSPNRVTPAQIASNLDKVYGRKLYYSSRTALQDVTVSRPHAGSVTNLATQVITRFYDAENLERAASEVTAPTATNVSRMTFFNEAAIAGLRQIFGATQGDTLAEIRRNASIHTGHDAIKMAIAIEALFEAAYFGSGRACQSLIEANELEIITLTEEEIRQLVTAQIYWHRASLSAQTPRDENGVDEEAYGYANELSAAQCAPDLVGLRKAWDAVHADFAVFQNLMQSVYFHSGLACQALIDANEHSEDYNLSEPELRQLVHTQITLYLAARDFKSLLMQDPLQVMPILLKNKKAWKALKQDSKDSYQILLDYFHQLTSELPRTAEIATPEDLVRTTENEPQLFMGYLEDRAMQQATHALSTSQRLFADGRVRVLKALFALRHDVFARDLKALYAMRPAIAAKIQSNASDDKAAEDRVSAEEARLEMLNMADLKDAPNPEQTIKYIGEGSTGLKGMFDTTKGKVIFDTRAEYNEKVQKATKENNQKKLDGYQARLAHATQEYNGYLSRKEERVAQLQEFKNKEAALKAERENELTSLKNKEQRLTRDLVESNPITECIRLAFSAQAQDLAAYGIPTYNWLGMIAKGLEEDLIAYTNGVFAFKYAETSNARESLPVLLIENAPAYIALFTLFMESASHEDFWAKVQGEFFDSNGYVVHNDTNALQKAFPVTKKKAEVVAMLASLKEKYKVANHVDPLLALFNNNMMLALTLSVAYIFPSENVLENASVLSARLTKLVSRTFSGAPSRLRNYLQMALVTMHDKAALARLLERNETNPLYGILLDKKVIKAGEFDCRMPERVQDALDRLIAGEEITLISMNDSYIVLDYLKKMIGEATEVDFLLFECFSAYVEQQFVKKGGNKPKEMDRHQTAATEKRDLRKAQQKSSSSPVSSTSVENNEPSDIASSVVDVRVVTSVVEPTTSSYVDTQDEVVEEVAQPPVEVKLVVTPTRPVVVATPVVEPENLPTQVELPKEVVNPRSSVVGSGLLGAIAAGTTLKKAPQKDEVKPAQASFGNLSMLEKAKLAMTNRRASIANDTESDDDNDYNSDDDVSTPVSVKRLSVSPPTTSIGKLQIPAGLAGGMFGEGAPRPPMPAVSAQKNNAAAGVVADAKAPAKNVPIEKPEVKTIDVQALQGGGVASLFGGGDSEAAARRAKALAMRNQSAGETPAPKK